MNIFDSPQVTNAFARSERLLGNQTFTLDDNRTLTGTINRVRRGEVLLENDARILADAVVVATRPQFTPEGGEELLPVALETTIQFADTNWRAEFVSEDETHVTLYVCRTSNPLSPQ